MRSSQTAKSLLFFQLHNSNVNCRPIPSQLVLFGPDPLKALGEHWSPWEWDRESYQAYWYWKEVRLLDSKLRGFALYRCNDPGDPPTWIATYRVET